MDKITARKRWNLSQNKKIMLFGAMHINDKLKGFSELIDAIGKISTKNVEAVIFGSSNPVNLLDSKIKTQDLIGNTIVAINKKYFRPTEVETLLGDPTKAKEKLGWVPKISFKEMVQEMMESDLALIKKETL